MMKKIIFITFVLILPSPHLVSAADLNEEVKILKEQVAALRQGSIQGNTSAADAASLQEMKSEFQALKAAIDANEHMIRSHTEGLNLKMQEIEARISSLEERLSIQGKQVTSAVSSVAPEAAEEAGLYQGALNQINNSEFLKGVATLKKFMQKFPKSEYNSSAQYWIGECYFAMRDFEQAIKEFQTLKEKYPQSERVPASLLKQGYAFIELNMESDAKLFLNTLIKKYPHSREANEAKGRLERMEKLKEKTAQQNATKEQVPLAPGVKVPGEKPRE